MVVVERRPPRRSIAYRLALGKSLLDVCWARLLREGADVVAGVVLCGVVSSRSDEARVANSVRGREELLDVANRLSRIDVQLILAVCHL